MAPGSEERPGRLEVGKRRRSDPLVCGDGQSSLRTSPRYGHRERQATISRIKDQAVKAVEEWLWLAAGHRSEAGGSDGVHSLGGHHCSRHVFCIPLTYGLHVVSGWFKKSKAIQQEVCSSLCT